MSTDSKSKIYIDPIEGNLIKWGWNNIPKIISQDDKFYIFVAINKIKVHFENKVKDLSKAENDVKKWIKIQINSKMAREKINTLRKKQEREGKNIKFSLITKRGLINNI